jgi:hypothetical protein
MQSDPTGTHQTPVAGVVTRPQLASGWRSGWDSGWDSFGVLILLIVLQGAKFLRVTDRVWAEDGAIFGRQAFDFRPLRAIRESYGGYLVVGQRILVAPIVSVIPADWWSEWFTVSSLAVSTVAAFTVFRASRSWIASPVLRAVLAAYLVVGPKMRGEWPSVTNIAWPMLMALFWVVISLEHDRVTFTLRMIIATTPLCTPLAMLFLPLAAANWFLHRKSHPSVRRTDTAVATVLALSSVIQLNGMRTAAPGPPAEEWTILGLVRLVSVRAVDSVLIGERWLESAWLQFTDLLTIVGCLTVIAMLFWCAWHRSAHHLVAAAALVMGIGIGTVSLVLRGMIRFAITEGFYTTNADRYFLLPAYLVMSAVFILVSRLHPRWALLQLSVSPLDLRFLEVREIPVGNANFRR